MEAGELSITASMPGVLHLRDALGAHMTLLTGTHRALLVDAGYGLCDLQEKLKTFTALPMMPVCTHAHYDHALGCLRLPNAYLSETDYPAWQKATGIDQRMRVLARLRSERIAFSAQQREEYVTLDSKPFQPLREEWFHLGGMDAQVIPMPGHTRGSIGIWVPQRQLLLAGDNLNPVVWLFFKDSCPLSDYAEMMRSLLRIPFAFILCPHADRLYLREEAEAYVRGLSTIRLGHAQRIQIPPYTDIATVSLSPAQGFTLVTDGERDGLL